MSLQGVRIGVVVTASHCTFKKVFPEIRKLAAENAELYPVVSNSAFSNDTRFGPGSYWCQELMDIAKRPLITTIVEAEPIGPKKMLDVLLVAPCTGNSIAKLTRGITDTPALMAVKAQLRNQRPVVIAISSNDGLGLNAGNIAVLLNTKNIFVVPFGQDDPFEKPNSLVSHCDLIVDALRLALVGKQLQPLIIEYKKPGN